MGCGSSAAKASAPGGNQNHIKVVPEDPQQPATANKVSTPSSSPVANDEKSERPKSPVEPENEPATVPNSVEQPAADRQNSKKGSDKSGKGDGEEKKHFSRSEKQTKKVQKIAAKAPATRDGPDSPKLKAGEHMSPENRKFLSKVLQKHFLFAGLEDNERNSVIDYMSMQKVANNDVVFSQGDQGDCCYIIQSGIFTVSIDDAALKQLRPKHTFGELAMLYNVNRTATVSCKEAGTIWQMSGDCFRDCMEKLSDKHVATALGFLDSDPNFSKMMPEDRKKLADACTVQVFGRNEQILREGEVGDWMFIVIEGNVQTVDRHGNAVVKKPGTILGSAGLMYTKQQVSGAKAIDNVMCLALGKSQLERLIGPVEEVLRSSAIKALLVDNVQRASDISFFKQLTEDQQINIIKKFEEGVYQDGETVFTQGSRAQLIIVIEGELAVLPAGHNIDGITGADAKKAAVECLTSGQIYGGKFVLDNCPMEASAVAATQCRIHRVGHDMIAEAVEEPLGLAEVLRLNEIKKVLSDIFLFKNLSEDKIMRVVRSLERRRYAAGETIVRQGDEAHHFFLIQSGTISVTKDGGQVRTLGRWDYLGERALLLEEKRSATCSAQDTVICFMLDAKVFKDIVGIFRKELEHRMRLQDLNLTMSDLRMQAVVGRGSFGIVKLVYHKNDESKVYALKCVSKKQAVAQGQQKSIVVEREINAQCYHPCLMQFIKTFQDSKNVYFLTEFLGGGDLFYAIREIGNLNKEQSRYYSASIALALEYLHARNIMYRDLKPENVLLDFHGNAKMVDFGCCKQCLRTNTLVGTPEYFAPETILGKGYTQAIDWWALGVMAHEFIVGPLPFGRETEDQLDLFREILEAPLSFPKYINDEAALSLVSGLLERTPELRLGASTRGAKEIKEHVYYMSFDWDSVVGRVTPAPWKPNQSKLQENWEWHKGDPVSVEGESPPVPEHGMEWASVF
jgi:cGMP-dependent protein kinase